MLIKLDQFSGMSEAVSPRLLDQKFAVKAVNCRVDRGALEPIRLPLAVRQLPHNAKSIYRYSGDNWFSWTVDVDVAKSAMAYDTTDRVYFTGVDYPRQTRNDIALGGVILPTNSYRVGVPQPNIPTASVIGAPNPDLLGLENLTYYVVTFVTAWGEEGPPSLPSNAALITEKQTVRVTLPAAPSGNYNWGAGARKRIYRSNSGTQMGAFQYVGEVGISVDTFDDSLASDQLGEVIPSITWDGPPDDNRTRYSSGQMRGIRTLASGAMVGFSGNTLVYSVPYLPHAWAYSYPLKDQIVAIEVTSTGVLVATKDRPVLAIGLDPSAVSIQELDERQACVSKRSMVDMGEYAIYASPDGLVGLEGGSASLLTAGLFRREDWQRFQPDTISAFRWEGMYVAFYNKNGVRGGFIFKPGDQTSPFIELDFFADAGFYDASEDVLYLAQNRTLVKFDHGIKGNYTWRSKLFQLPRPAAMSAIQVIADEYPVPVRVFKDGTAEDYLVQNDRPMRIATGRAHNWQFEFTGNRTLHSFAIAQSVGELADA